MDSAFYTGIFRIVLIILSSFHLSSFHPHRQEREEEKEKGEERKEKGC